MDRLKLFDTFVRVVDCASFTRAADQMDLPRSSVSTAIRTLEERVGARLLHRTTRRVAPTDEGLAFYGRCRQLLSEAEEAEAMFHHAVVGRVRANVPGRIGRLIVAPALPDFLDAHPGLEVELGATDRSVNLVEEGIDCVLRVGSLPDSSLIGRWIGDVDMINVAAPAYLEGRSSPQTPDDLDQHQVVNFASPATGRLEPWEWVEDGHVRTRPAVGRVAANSAEAAIACCLAGLGLLQIPAFDVALHLEKGELIEVMPEHRAEAMPAHLLVPHRRHAPERVRVFADWLAEVFRDALARGQAQAGFSSSRLSR